MKFSLRPIARELGAVAAGLCWAAAFPRWDLAGLAWVAPALVLFPTINARPGAAFRLGYLAGLAYALTAFSWLLHIPFPAGALAGWLALSAYLALYPATWVWLSRQLLPRPAAPPADPAPVPGSRVLHLTWAQRTGWTLACAALWVTLEMIQARLLSGFPWNFLGVSQHRLTPLIQIASVTGVYGLSFLIVWCSLALGLAAWRLPRTTGGRWGWMAELRLPLLAFVAVTYFGLHRLWSTQPAPDRELNLVLVQPSIPQVLIWDHRADSNRFQQVVELSRLALATQPQVLVWPEAAMPGFTEQNFQTITNLIATHRVWMVFGADDVGPRTDTPDPDDREFYNGAFLFDPQGRYVARYHKQKLVIFGEYVPLGRWLPFMKWLTPIEEGFTAGRGPVTFELGDPPCRTSVLICFEDVFPHSARRHVTPDLDFLLNLTNNGWFGRSAAQWQHAANAVFRAVENHRPLVRCTNNGLTCWIDPLGRLRQGLGLDTRDIYGPGFMTARIPLPAPGQRPPPTFYNRHGDGFGWGCVLVSGAALAIRRLPRLRR